MICREFNIFSTALYLPCILVTCNFHVVISLWCHILPCKISIAYLIFLSNALRRRRLQPPSPKELLHQHPTLSFQNSPPYNQIWVERVNTLSCHTLHCHSFT